MNLDFLGAEQNFTQLVGSQPEWVLDFQYDDGRALAVDDVFFSGVVVLPDGVITGLDVEQDSSAIGRVVFKFPRLMEGVYSYELMADGEDGSRLRMAYGRLGVHRTNLELGDQLMEEYEEALNSERRLVTVRLPKGMAERCVLAWRGSSAAMVAAEKALDAARRAEAAAEKLDAVDATMEQLDAQVQEFRVFVANWHDSVRSVLVMNPVTGTIWVGGHDTGQPYRGEDGKAPRVNADGNWETYNGQEWRDIGVRAFGRDGVDGDSMRHIMLDSEDDLPASAERGVVYITPKPGGGYNMWIWVENLGWLNSRTDTYGYATANNIGMVKLATDYPVTDGAPVGFNAQKQAMVPSMTTSVAGSAKVSTSSEMSVARKDGIIGKNANGQLMARRARPGQAGVMEPSRTDGLARVLAVGIVPDGTMVDGIDRSGQTGCTRAQADTYGMVKVAFVSTNEACNDIEWNVPVGIRDDMTETVQGTTDSWYRGANGMLYIPLSAGGCLQWVSSGVQRKDGKQWSTGGVLKFRHSAQFGVGGQGLELLPATTEQLAGVYLAMGVDDERSAAVLNARQAKAAFPGKGDVYDKAAADERYMRRSGSTHTVVTCTPDEMARIAAAGRDKHTIYIVANKRSEV